MSARDGSFSSKRRSRNDVALSIKEEVLKFFYGVWGQGNQDRRDIHIKTYIDSLIREQESIEDEWSKIHHLYRKVYVLTRMLDDDVGVLFHFFRRNSAELEHLLPNYTPDIADLRIAGAVTKDSILEAADILRPYIALVLEYLRANPEKPWYRRNLNALGQQLREMFERSPTPQTAEQVFTFLKFIYKFELFRLSDEGAYSLAISSFSHQGQRLGMDLFLNEKAPVVLTEKPLAFQSRFLEDTRQNRLRRGVLDKQELFSFVLEVLAYTDESHRYGEPVVPLHDDTLVPEYTWLYYFIVYINWPAISRVMTQYKHFLKGGARRSRRRRIRHHRSARR